MAVRVERGEAEARVLEAAQQLGDVGRARAVGRGRRAVLGRRDGRAREARERDAVAVVELLGY